MQLRSVIVTAPDGLREELRRLPLGKLLNRCSRFRRSSSRTPAQLATILVLRTLARRIHTIVLQRRQHDPATRDYIARRISDGKTSRDAVRLLKRYLARHLYPVMQNSSPLTT